MSARYAATAVFAGVVIAAGLLHGMFTNRWVPPEPLDPYLARLRNVPDQFAGWETAVPVNFEDNRGGMMEVKEINGRREFRFQDNLELHGINDYLFRVYREKRGTEHFDVLIVAGRPGPISTHTPDVCYRNSGFKQLGDQRNDTIETKEKNYPLFVLTFEPPENRSDLSFTKHIYWGFVTVNNGVETSDSARIQYSMEPVLYKYYVIHDEQKKSTEGKRDSLSGAAKAAEADSSKRVRLFLAEFLPRMEEALKNPAAPVAP